MRVTGILITLAVCSTAALGCDATLGEDCAQTPCAEGLECVEWTCRTKAQAESWRRDKAKSKECKAVCGVDGKCGVKDGKCVAISDADCRKTDGCRDRGLCSARDGECIAALDDDCKGATNCKLLNQCHAIDGKCGVNDEACRSLDDCKHHGKCAARDGACIAASDKDCEASRDCWTGGRCTHNSGRCVLADDHDCVISSWCAHFGHCKYDLGECAADARSFRDSEACRRYGCCGKGEGDRCKAVSDEDCEKSILCGEAGKCFARNGECAESCAETYGCRAEGLCTDGPGGRCIAGSDDDCKKSQHCADYAYCTAKGGGCVATEADCKAHENCAKYHRCWSKGGKCTATAKACRESEACRERGSCALVEGWCKPTTPQHCKQSENCRNSGWCHFDRRRKLCLEKDLDGR